MTQFHQEHQTVQGIQQNASRDSINNNVPKATWTPPRAQSFVGREEDLAWLLQQLTGAIGVTLWPRRDGQNWLWLLRHSIV